MEWDGGMEKKKRKRGHKSKSLHSDLLTMSSIFKILLTVSAANLMAEVDTSSG